MSIFKDKVLLISGGTGSFGNAVLKRFLRTDIGEIRIFPVMRRNRMTCATSIRPSIRMWLTRSNSISVTCEALSPAAPPYLVQIIFSMLRP